MAFIEVTNKKVSFADIPPSGYTSWLDYWQKKTGRKATECVVSGCYHDATAGGHVLKKGKASQKYVVPMCHGCKKKSENEIIKISEDDLVPIN